MEIQIMPDKQLQHEARSYTAIFDPAEDGGFNVSFPAFPGCITFGNNMEEAKKSAKEILELWIEQLIAQKEEIPTENTKPILGEVEVLVPVA
jgi:antitoxin HicB